MLRDVIEGRREVKGMRATPSIELGYADQSLDHIPDDQTPLAYITRNFDVGDARARALLAGAGFAHEFQTRPIKVMSWGQKSRLGLLGLRLAEPNFYLLDEPTNHIDIPGQDDLAAEIKDRGATCFLVSHDRQFVRDVGTRFWVVEKGRITEADDPEAFFASQGEGAS
jgi:ATPase subunit of ABC transporter with duplicated ATPase domains